MGDYPHPEEHPLAGVEVTVSAPKTPTLADGRALDGATLVVEDWADRVYGGQPCARQGNPVMLEYAVRSTLAEHSVVPLQIVHGKIGGLACVVHDQEIVMPFGKGECSDDDSLDAHHLCLEAMPGTRTLTRDGADAFDEALSRNVHPEERSREEVLELEGRLEDPLLPTEERTELSARLSVLRRRYRGSEGNGGKS